MLKIVPNPDGRGWYLDECRGVLVEWRCSNRDIGISRPFRGEGGHEMRGLTGGCGVLRGQLTLNKGPLEGSCLDFEICVNSYRYCDIKAVKMVPWLCDCFEFNYCLCQLTVRNPGQD
jgi:hypothetical protein